MKFIQALLTVLCLGVSQVSLGANVSVAVASNFTAPMKAVAQKFEELTGHRVILSFGSSGKFFAQITHGAPYDIFLSADQSKPEKLEEKGFAVSGSRFTYARGILALWSMYPEPEHRLKFGQVDRIAIPNPRLAPYGIAAVDTLKAINRYEALLPKLVKAENVSQSYQFTYTNNAEMGFIALSQISLNNKINRGHAWIVPEDLHSPILQDAVLLPRGQNSEAANALLAFLKTDEVRSLISTYGYSDPGNL